jgi:hypothetical protein
MTPTFNADFGYNRSYEGLSVFTAPTLKYESHPYTLFSDKQFEERIVLCAITRCGRFEVFVENDITDSVPGLIPSYHPDSCIRYSYIENKSSGIKDLDQSLRVIEMEKLVNVSDSKDLAFGGEGLGK